ncbi:MAG: FKBP-type peptidyl-prolyl cis-trans isomerase [Bacteroidales bacterium]|jgi:FKBP-type peptidyl-prolyl cis-trans isomerase|nr:FKBP-type peptidyl-prolyl cis-trans isomerase [Bacteroidales bacterium]
MKFKFEKLLTACMLCMVVLSLVSCSKYKGYQKHETGYYYKIHQSSDTAYLIQKGDYPVVAVELRVGDSLITAFQEMFAVDTILYEGDLNTALLTLHTGDSATFIFNKDQFASHYMNDTLDFPEEDIYITVKVHNVTTKAEVDEFIREMEVAAESEPGLIEQFLTENNWDKEPTPQGIYFREVEKGKGEAAQMYDMVTINYTGMLLDGTVFDSSENRGPFTIQLGVSQVIPGWNIAVSMMKKGEIAEVIIPSRLAYYDRGNYVIPPFSPLHFKIEIINIEKSPEEGFNYQQEKVAD